MTLTGLPVEFIGSFPDPLHILTPALPEVAFVGRSNVGKSSLLNALLGRKELARVSATPGKTQLMNVFRHPKFYLIDLPGYGFAKASKGARKDYRTLLDRVISERPTITGVVWLLDARHTPTSDDADIKEMLAATGRPALPVLTKADKLTKNEQAKALSERARELVMAPGELLLTSSTKGTGIAELRDSIEALVRG